MSGGPVMGPAALKLSPAWRKKDRRSAGERMKANMKKQVSVMTTTSPFFQGISAKISTHDITGVLQLSI